MWKQTVLSGLAALAVLVTCASQACAESMTWRDLDGNGVKESRIFMGPNGWIRKIIFDSNRDQKPEGTVFYQYGIRSHAVLDLNGDGQADCWISYSMSGQPWKKSEDRDGNGHPDFWAYYRDGRICKWEQDRNGDGIPDVRTIVDDRQGPHQGSVISQWTDEDFDGLFESGLDRAKTSEPAPVILPAKFLAG